MKNKRKAIIMIAIFTIVSFFDCYITWLNTPDLAMEANPLIKVFGLGWTALIVSNVITLIIFALAVWFSFVIYKTPVITAFTQQELDEKVKNINGKWGTIAMLGYSMGYSLIFSRLIVVAEWIAYHFSLNRAWMETLEKILHSSRPDIVVSVVITLALSIVWIIKEEKMKKLLAEVIPQEKKIEEETY